MGQKTPIAVLIEYPDSVDAKKGLHVVDRPKAKPAGWYAEGK